MVPKRGARHRQCRRVGSAAADCSRGCICSCCPGYLQSPPWNGTVGGLPRCRSQSISGSGAQRSTLSGDRSFVTRSGCPARNARVPGGGPHCVWPWQFHAGYRGGWPTGCACSASDFVSAWHRSRGVCRRLELWRQSARVRTSFRHRHLRRNRRRAHYWDGNQVSPTDATLFLAPPTVDGFGVPVTNEIDNYQIDATSGVQTGMLWGTYRGAYFWHADGFIAMPGSQLPWGVYGVPARLTSPGFEPSDPFMLTFGWNFGIVARQEGAQMLQSLVSVPEVLGDFNLDVPSRAMTTLPGAASLAPSPSWPVLVRTEIGMAWSTLPTTPFGEITWRLCDRDWRQCRARTRFTHAIGDCDCLPGALCCAPLCPSNF